MKIDIGKLVNKLLVIIPTLVRVIETIRGAGNGQAKKEEVIRQLPELISLGEFAFDRDLLNDANVMELVSALIDAEKAVLKAREALRAGIVNKPVK